MRRLLPLILLPLLAVLAPLSPAAASNIFIPAFTVDGHESVTVTAGDTVTFAWEAFSPDESTVDLTSAPAVAEWDETGVEDNGTRTVTLTEPGNYIFTVNVNIEDQGNEGLATEEVSVEVLPAEATLVDPDPVTFPDTCTVLIPKQAGVSYGYGTGAMGGGLEPGTHDLADLGGPGVELTFAAFPLEGYVFPRDTDTLVIVTPPDACFGASDSGDDDADHPTAAPAAGV